MLFPNNDAIFQDDDLPIHTARSAESCFENHEDALQHLFWLEQSPDFNSSLCLSMFSNAVLNDFVLLTCFHHSHVLVHYSYTDRCLWLSNWMGEVVVYCQCDMKSCSDGISIISATTLFMYQVDYNKLQLSHPILDGNILLELCCNLWAWFYVCLYLLFSSFILGE